MTQDTLTSEAVIKLFKEIASGNRESVMLNDELRRHLQDGSLGMMIHHPLMIEIGYAEQMNELYNRRFDAITEQCERLLRDKQYDSWIFRHERPYRWEPLRHVRKLIKTDDDRREWWRLFAEVYIDTENWHQTPQRAWVTRWVNDDRRNHPATLTAGIMNDIDRATYDDMPDELTVYRGWNRDRGNVGWSWTLSRATANWFATRFLIGPDKKKKAQVAIGRVNKSDVLAYWGGRKEDEVFVPFKAVQDIEIGAA